MNDPLRKSVGQAEGTISKRAQKPHRDKVGCEFHPVPKELLRSGKLSFGALVLFSVILNLSDRGRRLCTKTNDELAVEIGRNRSDVIRYLAEIEEAGLITRRFGQSQRTREGIEVRWTPERVTESSVTGDSKFGHQVTESSATILKNRERTMKEFAGGVSPSSREEQSKPLRFPHKPGQPDPVAELERHLASFGWSLGADGLPLPRCAGREGDGYPLPGWLRKDLADYQARIAAAGGAP